MNKQKILSFFLLLLFVISCNQKVPITNRRQLILIPENELLSMSFSQYTDFIRTNEVLPRYHKDFVLVEKVGKRIQQAVQEYMRDKGMGKRIEGYQWEFNTVEDPTVNAWCMPGGKVVVYSGLLPVTQDETGLAIVMGHEIAHAVARHGNERMSQQMAIQLGGVALSVALNSKSQETQNIFMQSYGLTSQLGILKYSRTHESEADKMGLIFAALAGYDPNAAIGFWQRMAEQSKGNKPPELLSTHPSDETRINDIKAFMPEAMKYYRKYE
jgi:predicted Zn-dependent protease